jgi:hypothetical protein
MAFSYELQSEKKQEAERLAHLGRALLCCLVGSVMSLASYEEFVWLSQAQGADLPLPPALPLAMLAMCTR